MKYLMALTLALFLTGCVETVIDKQEWKAGVAEVPEYPKLNNYNLTLNLAGKRELVAGSEGTVSFVLENEGHEKIRVIEWYANEPDNLKLYCQIWTPDMTEPDENAWTEITLDKKKPTARYPLELYPGNKVILSRNLDFIQSLVVSRGAERRYFIKAELDLTSVTVKSPVCALVVKAPEDMKKALR